MILHYPQVNYYSQIINSCVHETFFNSTNQINSPNFKTKIEKKAAITEVVVHR